MRKILPPEKVHPAAQTAMQDFHASTIQDIEIAIQQNAWVILGMAHNPVVKSAKKYLAAKNISFHSLEYGSYFSLWKLRLAIKLWSGWPTYPQIFHNGILIGGFSDLKAYLP